MREGGGLGKTDIINEIFVYDLSISTARIPILLVFTYLLSMISFAFE